MRALLLVLSITLCSSCSYHDIEKRHVITVEVVPSNLVEKTEPMLKLFREGEVVTIASQKKHYGELYEVKYFAEEHELGRTCGVFNSPTGWLVLGVPYLGPLIGAGALLRDDSGFSKCEENSYESESVETRPLNKKGESIHAWKNGKIELVYFYEAESGAIQREFVESSTDQNGRMTLELKSHSNNEVWVWFDSNEGTVSEFLFVGEE